MRDEYERVRTELAIAEADFALVAPQRHREITLRILERFTTLGKRGLSAAWWWESFREETWSLQPKDASSLVAPVLKPAGRYWLVAASTSPAKKESRHWIYDATGAAILRLLGVTHRHEYYIVEKKLAWLLCENHHGVVIACGRLDLPDLTSSLALARGRGRRGSSLTS